MFNTFFALLKNKNHLGPKLYNIFLNQERILLLFMLFNKINQSIRTKLSY